MTNGDDVKLGTSTTLNTVVPLREGDEVFLEVDAEGNGGLINSDWYLLKFSGHMLPEDTAGK